MRQHYRQSKLGHALGLPKVVNRHYRHIREPGKPSLIDLPIFPGLAGERIRVLESPLANRGALLDKILKRHYHKPFIGESANGRSLYLSLDCVQSRMRLDDPWALDLRYTRKVMSFLLFQPEPRDVLMLGLGGGSLAKFCHRHLPGTRLDAVEISADVIALRDYFCVPSNSPRFAIHKGDAAEYVARTSQSYDVVIADAFDWGGIAPSIRTGAFYQQIRSRLSAGGLLVANLAGETAERVDHLRMMAREFSDNVLLVPVEGEGNEIAIAFKDPQLAPGWSWNSVRQRAYALTQSLGLDFPRFARRLERSCKLGYLRRALSWSA